MVKSVQEKERRRKHDNYQRRLSRATNVLAFMPSTLPRETRKQIMDALDMLRDASRALCVQWMDEFGNIERLQHGKRIPGNKYTHDIRKQDYGDLMIVEAFRKAVEAHSFIDYDGFGCAVLNDMENQTAIYPSQVHRIPYNATHIMWYNR